MACNTIERITRGLEERGFEFVSKVTTNGFFLSKDKIELIQGWHVLSAQVTFDALGDKYDEIKAYEHCGGSAFDRVMRNVLGAVEAGVNVRVRINYDPRDMQEVRNAIDFMLERIGETPLLSFHVNPIYSNDIPTPAAANNSSCQHPYLQLLDFEDEIHARSIVPTDTSDAPSYDVTRFTPWCNPRITLRGDARSRILANHYLLPIPTRCYGVCNDSIAIDSRGDLYVCHKLLGKGAEYACGNVRDGFTSNEVVERFQNPGLANPGCSKCVLLPACQGGCMYNRLNYSGGRSCVPIMGAQKEVAMRAYGLLADI